MSYIGNVGHLNTTINSDVSKFTYEYIATADQTVFTGADINAAVLGYTPGNIVVTYGGGDIAYSDYTATDGVSVVLADGALVGKIIRITAFQAFEVADTYTKAVIDSKTGGQSLGTSSVIRTNAKVIAEDITFAGTENGSSVGPITVADTFTVTVTSGSTWVIL
jgi:hypothetical protein